MERSKVSERDVRDLLEGPLGNKYLTAERECMNSCGNPIPPFNDASLVSWLNDVTVQGESVPPPPTRVRPIRSHGSLKNPCNYRQQPFDAWVKDDPVYALIAKVVTDQSNWRKNADGTWTFSRQDK